MLLFVVVAAVPLAAVISMLLVRLARIHNIVDRPNDRTLHDGEVPRGGGVAIVVVVLLGWASLFVDPATSSPWMVPVGLGALLAGATGFADDLHSLPPNVRLFLYAGASVLFLWLAPRAPHIELTPLPPLSPLPLAVGFSVLFLLWVLNLYNFMDGIDGIAGIQALTVSLGAAVIAFGRGAPGLGAAYLMVAAASTGFLTQNWSPAKIFMGDVGSAFLGFSLGALGIWGATTEAVPLATWLILMGCFVVDSSWTLTRRFLSGDRVFEPHRKHAYQHAVQRGHSHTRVSLTFAFVTLVWLFPLAMLSVRVPQAGAIVLTLAWLPLLVAAIHYRAGLDEPIPIRNASS